MFDFLGGFFDGLGSILNDVLQFLAALLQQIILVFRFLAQLLGAVFQFLLTGLTKVYGFLSHLWNGLIKGILGRVLHAIQIAHKWLEAHLAPVIRFLRHARAIYDRWYRLYIRPYLAMIQRMRRYIAVLRLLHIHIADALDKRLAQEEAFVAQWTLTIRKYLNQAIDTVNALTDPPKLARFIVASVSGRRAAAAMSRLLTGLPIGHWFPRSHPSAFPWEKPFLSAKDYQDPERNPSVTSLLGGLFSQPPLGVDSADGVPTDAQLDGLESVPWGDEFVAQLAAEDAAFDALEFAPLSIAAAVVENTGAFASGAKAGSGLVSVMFGWS